LQLLTKGHSNADIAQVLFLSLSTIKTHVSNLYFKMDVKSRTRAILGDILNKTVPKGLEKYADEKLFKPLGISNYKWQYTPQNVPNTAGGIQMNALDFAKYGQLYKNGGIWNNQQILSKTWVEQSLNKQKQILGRDNEYYGYLFWNKTFKANDKDYEAYYCAGNGGNYILIFKNEPLVIVITASAYGQYYAHSQVTEMLSKYILPAVTK
jgi:CubicO group peptidase (beta-lactamase class C family)